LPGPYFFSSSFWSWFRPSTGPFQVPVASTDTADAGSRSAASAFRRFLPPPTWKAENEPRLAVFPLCLRGCDLDRLILGPRSPPACCRRTVCSRITGSTTSTEMRAACPKGLHLAPLAQLPRADREHHERTPGTPREARITWTYPHRERSGLVNSAQMLFSAAHAVAVELVSPPGAASTSWLPG